ncbi:TetR/AcrR family transcriptional regulator [Rhodococcus sp. NPDC003318]|uniref:TetR/AcrR family transcriptional regulator n=1 Tax=Rhodococcus sp. NPDC003318 TaxID=3364503 RepID=UPI0036A3E2DF
MREKVIPPNTAGGPALRADARRNRNQIIVAAKSLFRTSGLDVSMEAIARTAGVGVGTLYRRFPDRAGLVAAVAAQSFRDVLADVTEAKEVEPSAWDAFVRLATQSENLRLTVHLAFLSLQSWRDVHAAPESEGVHREMMSALEALVQDAQEEGSIRRDIGAGDALYLISVVLGNRSPGTDTMRGMSTERSLRLVLDGLRAEPSGALPGEPVTVQELNTRMKQGADTLEG